MEHIDKLPSNANAVIFSSPEEKQAKVIFLTEDRRADVSEDRKFVTNDFAIPDNLWDLARYRNGLAVTFANCEMHGLSQDKDSESIIHKVFCLKTFYVPTDENIVEFLTSVDIRATVDDMLAEWEIEEAMK